MIEKPARPLGTRFFSIFAAFCGSRNLHIFTPIFRLRVPTQNQALQIFTAIFDFVCQLQPKPRLFGMFFDAVSDNFR